MNLFFFVFAILVAASTFSRAQQPLDSQIDIEDLARHILKQGFDGPCLKRLNDIVSNSKANPDVSQKLRSTQEELISRLDQSFEDPRYHALLVLEHRIVTFLLADIYSFQDEQEKQRILTNISHNFVPNATSSQDLLPNMWPLLAIGKDAVPSLLQLATDKKKLVRCEAREALRNISKQLKGPTIKCVDNKMKLSGWRAWWLETGQSLPFPKIALPYRGPKAGISRSAE